MDPLLYCSDQGSEFKGALKGRFRKLGVKLINSRPYHPQSQGKENGNHCAPYVRALSSKMEYDSLKLAGRKVLIRRKLWLKTRGF